MSYIRRRHVFKLLLTFLMLNGWWAFVDVVPGRIRDISANALTQRQEQFWEDVEDGLDEIENYYKRRDMNIDRIRRFGMRARGEIPLETGVGEFHEPSEEHIEGLTAQSFWETTEFPWANALEEKSHIIQEEFMAKLQSDSDLFVGDSSLQNSVMGGGWSAIRLQRLGVWNLENCKEFPKTYELIKELDIPLAVRGVCFARQKPYSGVKTHSDGRNFILTSHLGIKIPKDCWIEVAKERRDWEEQRLITLDTSFLHSTGNPTAEDRYVLIIDFWHPELTEAERAGLEFIYDLRNKFETGLIPVRPLRKYKKIGMKTKTREENGIAHWWDKMLRGETNQKEIVT